MMDSLCFAATQVEFHDPKHGNGKAKPILGVVQTCDYKAKGGMSVSLIDASGSSHAIK